MNELFKYNSPKQEYLLNAINEYLEMEEFDSAIEFIKGRKKELEEEKIGVNKCMGYDFYIITKDIKRISNAKMVIVIDSKIQIDDTKMVCCYKSSNIVAKGCLSILTYNDSFISAIACDKLIAYNNSRIVACDVRNITLQNNAFGKFMGNSKGVAYDNCSVTCYNTSECVLYGTVKGYFYQFSKGHCYNESIANAYADSELKLHDRSTAFVFDDVKAKCSDSSSIEVRGTSETILEFGTKAIVADRTVADDRVGSLIAKKGSVVYAKEDPICNIILEFGAVNINTETKEAMVCE